MGPFSILTDTELEQMCDRAYSACMTYYDTLEARNDVHTPAWKTMRAAATEQAELHRSLSRELARRTAERYTHLGPVASLAEQISDELMRDV